MTLRVLLLRGFLLTALCALTAGGLWGLSLATVPGESTDAPAPPPPVPQDRVVLPRVPRVELAGNANPPAPQTAGVSTRDTADPLARWAAKTSDLLDVPASKLANYAAAEVAMRQRAPGCDLSWVTVAAIARVGSELVHPQRGRQAALEAARTLCAHGRDTGTEDGWVAAVRAVGTEPGYIHKVLAAATVYATVLRTGVPLTPQARTAIDFAISKIGLPYVWGGDGPAHGEAGFDCSGLTNAAYAAAGVNLPRTAHTQYFATTRVDHLRPGDLVFYGSPRTKIHHVGLYIGNGQMINAPTFGQPVQVAPVRWPGDDFAGAGRPVY